MWERVIEWCSNNRWTAVGSAFLGAVVFWSLFYGEGSPLNNAETPRLPDLQGVELRQILDNAEVAPPPVTETTEEEAKRLVAEYAKAAFDEPEAAEAPALLTAAGNLHMERLNQPVEAAGFYAQVVYKYPNWEGTPGVYPQLAKALELSGNQEERQRVLQDMMKRFPPEAPEHQYAAAELGQR